MNTKYCGFCFMPKEELIKSSISDVYICEECVGIIGEHMDDTIEVTLEPAQKVIQMSEYKK